METFEDLMMTTKGLPAKKAAILEIIKARDDFAFDEKLKFDLPGVGFLLKQDLDFYLEAMPMLERKLPPNSCT